MTTTAAEPLLSLSTLAPERPFITIDGARYELAVPDDFGLTETAAILRAEEGMKSLGDTNDEAAVEAAKTHLRTVTSRVLRAPPEVIAKLRDFQCLEVVEAFTRAVGKMSTRTPNRATRRRQTGATSSRASRASSAPTTG